jgi:hypothetical protein
VRAVEIVEALPDGQLFLEINVVAIREQLTELILFGSVGPLDLRTRVASSIAVYW